MNAPTTAHSHHGATAWAPGIVVPVDGIARPGCYVCNWSGHLLRVPEDGLSQTRVQGWNLVGHDRMFVTLLSDNPYITVTKARMIASNLNVAVAF